MNPLNKIFLGMGAAIALAVSIAIVWLMLANAHLKTQLAQAQAGEIVCHMANDEFTTSVATQNKAIDALRADAAAREAKAALDMKAADKTAQGFLNSAASLSRRKPMADACKTADDIANAYLGALK